MEKNNLKLKRILYQILIGILISILFFVFLMLVLSYFVSIGVIKKSGIIPSIEWIRTFGTLLSAVATITLGWVAYSQNKRLNKENERMQAELTKSNTIANNKVLDIQQTKLLSGYYTYIKLYDVCKLSPSQTLESKKVKSAEVKSANFIDNELVNTETQSSLYSNCFIAYFENAGNNPLSHLAISSVEVSSLGTANKVSKEFVGPDAQNNFINVPYYLYDKTKDPSKAVDNANEKTHVFKLNLLSEDSSFWETISQGHYFQIKLHAYYASLFNVVLEGDIYIIISNNDKKDSNIYKIFSSRFTASGHPYELDYSKGSESTNII